MKSITKILVSIMALTSPAVADLCGDLITNYAQRMLQLENDTNAALAQTTDPAEQAAIRQSFQMQMAQLEAEKFAALTSAGCNSVTPPPTPDPDPVPPPEPDPTTPPEPDPTTPPEPDPTVPPTPDPGTTPTPDPGTTPPPTPDPGTPPSPDPGTTPPGANCPPNNCFQELKDYAEQLKAQGVLGRDLIERVKCKARELGCNFGQWRSSINPGSHSYRSRHHRNPHCRHGHKREHCRDHHCRSGDDD